MRRKDRAMGEEFAFKIMDNAAYGFLSVIDAAGEPYGMPLSLVRKENSFYFHSAKSGKKVEAFSGGKNVCLTFVGEVQVPELFSKGELDSFLADETKGTMLASKVFTTEYESAMVFGNIYLVKDTTECADALRLICEKYTPSKMKYFELAIKSGLSKTNIYRIDIDKITAKRKKFDSSGEEMKWGRMV